MASTVGAWKDTWIQFSGVFSSPFFLRKFYSRICAVLGLLFSLPQVVVAVVVVIVVVVVVVPMLAYRSVPIYTVVDVFCFFWRVRR